MLDEALLAVFFFCGILFAHEWLWRASVLVVSVHHTPRQLRFAHEWLQLLTMGRAAGNWAYNAMLQREDGEAAMPSQ